MSNHQDRHTHEKLKPVRMINGILKVFNLRSFQLNFTNCCFLHISCEKIIVFNSYRVRDEKIELKGNTTEEYYS